ncbi:ComF family protein [Halalkalibacter okhensis]|uniref:Phosphoribosyltransferase domain-containing protein n=1 Tax=Halalkalibacter okhensis TaxID=333138 RepID=A0A0B0IFE7_9BACI|nr:ComF family protein [Halalkalibacter okhensis]KHF39617.1 hypothetical protein LQ50_14375 [Halalkalibacter okhensis]
MNRCLACHDMYYDQPGWRRVLMLEPPSRLCQSCEAKLIPIGGQRCITCSRSLDQLSFSYKKGKQCLDCWRWDQQAQPFDRNVSLYEYNAFLKEWIATFKFRGDAVIASYFSKKLTAVYERHFSGYRPVAIPLSQARLYARGFNQSKLLMDGWAKDVEVLERMEGEKQSKKNRKQRISQVDRNPFSIKHEAHVSGQAIVLIDDIYTTGTTVRQAAKVLMKHGAKKVASLTIAR